MIRRMEQKRGALAASGILLCILLAETVFAYWEQMRDTVNVLTMACCKAEIVEKYREPSSVEPAGTVEKQVNVRNSGTADILVRVSVKKMFGSNVDGNFREDKSLDGEMIEIQFHSKYWQKGDDGWFYYKEVLKAGESTREPLMDSYRLSQRAGNAYKGKEGHIVISMEAIQADESAAEVWGEEWKKTGIVWPNAPKMRETGVDYCGKEKGFRILGDGTDLFAMFKNLTPGCGRGQKIRLKNESEETVELFLHAENMEQEGEMIKQFLEKYAVIELKDEEKTLYEGPVGGMAGENPAEKKISLGVFEKGQEKNLVVNLHLLPEMDNQFQKFAANVKWIFTARGEDGTAITSAAPTTGDPSRGWKWILCMVIAGITAAGLGMGMKRR